MARFGSAGAFLLLICRRGTICRPGSLIAVTVAQTGKDIMVDWTKWLRTAAGIKPSAVRNATVERLVPPRGCGTYEPLHKYLDDRYATTVVLSLSEIEDILGFALPAPARTDKAWWTVADPDTRAGRYADAWKLANRTAVPNLVTRAVTFERVAAH